MYDINICGPVYDVVQNNDTNIRATRILFGIDILILLLIYNCISFFLKKNINSLRIEDKESNEQKIQALQLSYKKWENDYLLGFGDHAVSLGFVMSFSPYAFELILALSYIIIKMIYEVRLHRWQSETTLCKTWMRIVNMGILICGMVGLSRMSFDKDTLKSEPMIVEKCVSVFQLA